MASNSSIQNAQTPGFISVRDMFSICRAHWYWFAATLFLALAVAFFYIKRTAPTYSRTATIMLISGADNRQVDINLEGLGIENQNANLVDEMEMLQSPILMEEVVRRLHLNIEYISQGQFHDVLLYGEHSPIRITFSGDSILDYGCFWVTLHENKTVSLKFGEQGTAINCHLNTLVSTPMGDMLISPTDYYQRFIKNYQTVMVRVSSTRGRASQFLSNLKVSMKREKSSILNITLEDQSTQRAEDILNTLILVYDANWKESHDRTARNTADFLEERIGEIGSELGAFDDDVSSYKGSNLIPNVSAAQGIFMSKSSETDSRLQALSIQRNMLHSIRNTISGSIGHRSLLPSDTGLEDQSISSQINTYNQLLLQREEMVSNSGEDHPKVQQTDRQISTLGRSIQNAIDSYDAALSSQIAELRQVASHTAGRIVTSTQQEKHLMSIERQQKVKEQLYVFLLQEKEKASMSQAYVSSNVRTLQSAAGPNAPVAPLTRSIYLLAIAIALGVPFVILFLIEITDTMIRGRGDLETLATPILGEINKVKSLETPWYVKQRKHRPTIVFDQSDQSFISENFRIIRTNLQFMLYHQEQSRVIMLTSLGPDSGKTFLSANLAACFAQLNKKILVIDLDMRRHTLSLLVDRPEHDITDYLSHAVDDIDTIICPYPKQEHLDIIPVRKTPPNPSELLQESRFADLIQHLRQRYDYIFIDCPPVGLVADSMIISSVVDLSIFVVRSGKVDKNCIPLIDSFYNEQKLRNLCVILNCTPVGKKYGSSRYGYYGYSYYGHNYNYSSENKK